MPRSAKPVPSVTADALFSDAYLRLRERYLKTRRSAAARGRPGLSDGAAAAAARPELFRDGPSLNEKTLRSLWYEGRFERRGLKTVDGRPVSVLTPGEWNLDQGPDFRGAEFRLEGQVVRGDVEIHITDRDWNAHGHGRDPGYDGVALHVFLRSSGRAAFQPRRSDGAAVPSVSLMGRLPEPWSVLVQNFDAAGYPFNSSCGLGACGKKMSVARFDALERLLQLAGDGRVLLKAPGTADLYAGFAQGLGYHRNKAPMAELARRVPWSFIKSNAANVTASERAAWIEALLFGAAGLLEGAEECEEGRAVAAIWGEWSARLQAAAARGRPGLPSAPAVAPDCRTGSDGADAAAAPIRWVFRGVRPQNFPHRRLAALARLAARELDRPLPPEAGPGSLLVGPEGFFARHARWNSRAFARPAALVGEDRAQALWINVQLPSAVAACRRAGDAEGERRLHARYAALPLTEANGTARLMAHRLLGSERASRFPLKKEYQQQGLLQVFQDFCDTKPWACQMCSFPEVVGLTLAELNHGG